MAAWWSGSGKFSTGIRSFASSVLRCSYNAFSSFSIASGCVKSNGYPKMASVRDKDMLSTLSSLITVSAAARRPLTRSRISMIACCGGVCTYAKIS